MKNFEHLVARSAAAIAAAAVCALAQATPTPVAQYNFNGTLASSVAGAPALTAVDTLGESGFVTDTVSGTSKTVYNFQGANEPTNDQAGLSLNTTGLITNSSVYSVEMVFKFTERDNAWRRIFDTQERQSDNGFYVDPSNNLDVYPLAGGAKFTNNVYHDVFLVDNSGVVSFYLDGSAQANVTTSIMNLPADGVVNFFLDNVVAGGQGEFSSGDISLIRLYNSALDAVPPPPPPIPEPGNLALMLGGLALVGGLARRRVARQR
jgi:hypothetical protein